MNQILPFSNCDLRRTLTSKEHSDTDTFDVTISVFGGPKIKKEILLLHLRISLLVCQDRGREDQFYLLPSFPQIRYHLSLIDPFAVPNPTRMTIRIR